MNAYDLKELGEILKGKGLVLAEDATLIIYVAVKEWLAKSAIASDTPIDDIIIALFPQIDKLLLPQIDKIDGEVG